jgi:hypothetical protein
MMAFNPLEHRGIPLDKQLRNWSELNVEPYGKDVDPYTRCRVITLNGIEVESILFSHQFARHTDDVDLKRFLALTRRVEQQQQRAVNWLIPGDETTLEVTAGYEQVAIDLTAWVARSEPDPYLRQAYEFGVLEDFDHLYRYCNLLEIVEGRSAEHIIGRCTEVMPGRPTIAQHRHPYDDVRRHYDKHTVDPRSRLHALTVMSAEQQTMNFYMTIGNRYTEPIARALYAEIATIEEQHVTHYESLIDPLETWFEQLVMHEYNECYMYWSFMQQEVDPRIKAIWELHLNMEIEQLRLACEQLRRYEGKDSEEFLPSALPEPVRFQENKTWLREIIAEQVDLTTLGTEFVRREKLPFDAPYYAYQKRVHAEGVPSEQIIDEHRREKGEEYRLETEGPHPIKELRAEA